MVWLTLQMTQLAELNVGHISRAVSPSPPAPYLHFLSWSLYLNSLYGASHSVIFQTVIAFLLFLRAWPRSMQMAMY